MAKTTLNSNTVCIGPIPSQGTKILHASHRSQNTTKKKKKKKKTYFPYADFVRENTVTQFGWKNI